MENCSPERAPWVSLTPVFAWAFSLFVGETELTVVAHSSKIKSLVNTVSAFLLPERADCSQSYPIRLLTHRDVSCLSIPCLSLCYHWRRTHIYPKPRICQSHRDALGNTSNSPRHLRDSAPDEGTWILVAMHTQDTLLPLPQRRSRPKGTNHRVAAEASLIWSLPTVAGLRCLAHSVDTSANFHTQAPVRGKK